jgi:hypothetical protein
MTLTDQLKKQAINDIKKIHPDAIGMGKILPREIPYPKDEDSEVAELLASELLELSIIFTAKEMLKIRSFISRKTGKK